MGMAWRSIKTPPFLPRRPSITTSCARKLPVVGKEEEEAAGGGGRREVAWEMPNK